MAPQADTPVHAAALCAAAAPQHMLRDLRIRDLDTHSLCFTLICASSHTGDIPRQSLFQLMFGAATVLTALFKSASAVT